MLFVGYRWGWWMANTLRRENATPSRRIPHCTAERARSVLPVVPYPWNNQIIIFIGISSTLSVNVKIANRNACCRLYVWERSWCWFVWQLYQYMYVCCIKSTLHECKVKRPFWWTLRKKIMSRLLEILIYIDKALMVEMTCAVISYSQVTRPVIFIKSVVWNDDVPSWKDDSNHLKYFWIIRQRNNGVMQIVWEMNVLN